MAESIVVHDWMFKEIRRDAVLTYAMIYQHTSDGSWYYLNKKYVANWQAISVNELEFILSYLESIGLVKKSYGEQGDAYTVCKYNYCTNKKSDAGVPRGPHVIKNDVAVDVISYFNEKCGTNFRTNTANIIKLINGRLKEGYSKEDLYKVIDIKYEQWGKRPFRFSNGQQSNTYLRPSTLFTPKNFVNYLNEAYMADKKPETIGQSVECGEKLDIVY